MPLRTIEPILHLEPASLISLDTDNVMSFHGLWSVFSKCSETLPNGKRLENLSWRLFSRESSVCNKNASQRLSSPSRNTNSKTHSLGRIPELSSSINSVTSSEDGLFIASRAPPKSARPEISRAETPRSQKHISPLDLSKMVVTITEKTALEPLSPLPLSLSLCAKDSMMDSRNTLASERTPSSDVLPTVEETTPIATKKVRIPTDGSTSTVATEANIPIVTMASPMSSSQESSSTEYSEPKLVRGFSRDCISSYNHSRTQLAPVASQSILKPTPSPATRAEPINGKNKKKGFYIGPSSEEADESSFETRYAGSSSHMGGFRRPNPKKASFKDEALMTQIQEKKYESSDVFEDTDEDEEDTDVIDESDWEDDDEAEEVQQVDQRQLFKRVDSTANLTSRKSLLSNAITQHGRAAQLQNFASQSTPAIRRSRTTSPNGPVGTSPDEQRNIADLPQAFQSQASNPRSIAPIATSNPVAPTLSPRASRRLMLETEMPASLRKSMLWERQVRHTTVNAGLQRRHTSRDIQNLTAYPGPASEAGPSNLGRQASQVNLDRRPEQWNNYFDGGLQEYHQKGW